MSTQHPHLSLLARAFVTALTLAGLGLVAREHPSVDERITAGAVAPAAVDVVAETLARGNEPQLFPRSPTAVATATPVPTAEPAAVPVSMPSTAPRWGEVAVETQLRSEPDPRAPASQFLPKASSLRLLGDDRGWLHVRYGGNGDDHKAGEGWVNGSDVMPGSAPAWVEVLRGTDVWSSAVGGERVASVPSRSVVESLEDRGNRVRVFYAGDGFARDHVEGWVDSADLGPAGPLLISERYGLRVVTKSDVQSIESGKGTWLRVPYRTQLDGDPSADANCGPASVAMVLQYFRIAVPTSEVRAVADKLQGTHDPDGGFAIEYLSGTVERFGLKGLDLDAGSDQLKRWSLDDARRQLALGHPIIAQLRFRAMPGRASSDYGDDHYVVLAGTFGDDFIYNDSVDVDGPGYGRVISAAKLNESWGSSFFPYAGFAVSAP